MIRHFLKMFVRSSLRSTGYTIINISGLAIGLAASILILLWAWDETHFDLQHTNRDRIYQVKSFHRYPDMNYADDATSGMLASALKEFPEVQQVCRIAYFYTSRLLIQVGDNSVYERGLYADTTLFNIFTVKLIEGVKYHDNHSIVISQKLANKYFPNESAVGKSLRVNTMQDAVVTGVFEDQPETSSLVFDFIMDYDNYAVNDKYNQEWGSWSGGFTYMLLNEGTDIKALDEKIHKKITEPKIWPRWGDNATLFVFPFTDTHLRNNFDNDGKQSGGRIAYVNIFGGVAIFILLVAIINFMNLATARSASRSKEIGVRKVSGAVRSSLIRQFFSESVLLSLIGLIVAMVVVQVALPAFNLLTHKNLSIDWTLVPLILLITLITGLVAGSYPAFLLSSLKPIVVLKGKFTGTGGKTLRRSLVVFQFIISTVLIVCALVANQQMRYMKEKNLGFDRDNIMYFDASSNINKNIDVFKKQALDNPKIVSIAQGRDNPMSVFGGMDLGENAWPGKTKEDQIIFTWTQCDEDYLPTLGLNIVKGRNFSKENPGDSLNYIINEEAAKQMRLTDPVGARLKAPHEGTIVGVVKDFNSAKLQFKIAPTIIAMAPKRDRMVFVKYEAGQSQEVIAFIETLYKKFESEVPMQYKFMNEPFGEMYENEILIEKLSFYFTVIAIFISCLGLFGLASFTAETRTKEIGVRKVLGASVSQIVVLLCRDFVVLIAIALVVGLPIGWWGVDRFLDKYAYRIDLSPWLFITIVLGMIGTTFATVTYQSAKAANTNPVKTLRSE